MSAQVEVKKDYTFYIHVIITLFFMFIFGRIVPPVGPLTQMGMHCLGILIGVIYAWTTTSLIWPSFLGMVAMVTNGAYTMTEWLPLSFANSTVVFLLLIFAFTQVISDSGLVKFIASWLMSRKIVEGRPWLFTFFLLLGAYIGGVFVNSFATSLIFWMILYDVCKTFGFKPYEKYPTMMIFGIVLCACTLGASVLPYRLTAMVMIGTINSVAPQWALNSTLYLLYIVPTTLLMVICYMLIMKFVFRIDLSRMKAISAKFVNPDDLKLSNLQKVSMVFLLVAVVLLIAVDSISSLSGLSTIGVILAIMAVMFLVKVDGEPLMDFAKAAKGIQWQIIFLFAFILPFSNYLTSDATGIKTLLVNNAIPFFSSMSPFVFIFSVSFIGMILTNFTNNAVLSIMLITMSVPICEGMGISPLPLIMLNVFANQFAYLTPAASAPGAFVFANKDWVKPADMYKIVPLTLFLLFIVACVVAFPYACLIFGFRI